MQKIHIIAFLTLTICCSTASAEAPSTANSPIRAQMSVAQASPQNSRFSPEQRSDRPTGISSILFGGGENDPNFASETGTAGTRELFFKMMTSVAVVIILGAAAIYASKKLVGKIANLPGKKIKIVETAHLGPKKAVHLLRIGDRCLLIGSTNENITKLADLTTEIVMQENASTKGSGPEDTREAGSFTELGPAFEPSDALASLSTKYAENN